MNATPDEAATVLDRAANIIEQHGVVRSLREAAARIRTGELQVAS